MSKNDSLFSRKAEDEIDEALSWLETIGSGGDEADSSAPARRVDKTAYEVLPTWLKMDIRSDATITPPVEAPVADEDNLSWLDSIASGLGGPLAEPPTMSWDETAIYTVSEADKKQALADAANRIEKQFSDDERANKAQADFEDAADDWAISDEQLNAALGDAENLKEVTDHGKGLNVADLAALDDDVTQVYAKESAIGQDAISAEFPPSEAEVASSEIDELYASLDLPKVEIEDEPLIADSGKFVPDSTVIGEMPAELEIDVEDALEDAPTPGSVLESASNVTELYLPEHHSPLDEPTNIHGTDAETLRAAFPILEDESAQDKIDEIELAPPIDDLVNEPTIISLEPRGDLGSEIGNIDVDDFDDALQSLAESSVDDMVGADVINDDLTQIHPPNAGIQSQHDITQIFLPDDEEIEQIPLDHAAAGITEIYLPDDSSVIDDAITAAEEHGSSPSSADVTEIFLPQEKPAELDDGADADDVTQIYIPEEDDAPEQVEDVTQLFVPDADAADDARAVVDSAETQTGAELTEIYLPDEDSALMPGLDAGREQLDSMGAELTEIYLPDKDEDARVDELIEEAAAAAHQADLTEIHLPENPAPDMAELAGLDNGTGTPQDLTEIYLPDEDVSAEITGADLTEIYLPEDDESGVDALLEMAEAAPLPDLDGEKTQIFQHGSNATDALETLHASVTATPVDHNADIMSSGEPTQVVLPEDTREEPGASAFDVAPDATIISELPISERWRALIDQNESAADKAVEAGLLDTAEASSAALTAGETVEDGIADEIPEDPDEAMAWLEAMVRRQKDDPDKPATNSTEDRSSFIEKRGDTNDATSHDVAQSSLNETSTNLSEADLLDEPTRTLTGVDPIDLVTERGLAATTQISEAVPLDKVNDPAALGLELPDTDNKPKVPAEPMTEFQKMSPDLSDELSDALIWLEGVDESESVEANDVTVELNQEDIARLLEEHLAEKKGASQSIVSADEKREVVNSAPIDADYEDQPTMITEMPSHANVHHDIDGMGDSKELDEALAWLEAFSEDDETASQPGEIAANRLQKSYVEETVIPIYEVERLAAHAAYAKEDFAEIYESFQAVLAKKDPLGANVIAEDVGLWVAKHPDEPVLHRLLGEAYLQLKRFEKSARAFRRVIELT